MIRDVNSSGVTLIIRRGTGLNIVSHAVLGLLFLVLGFAITFLKTHLSLQYTDGETKNMQGSKHSLSTLLRLREPSRITQFCVMLGTLSAALLALSVLASDPIEAQKSDRSLRPPNLARLSK